MQLNMLFEERNDNTCIFILKGVTLHLLALPLEDVPFSGFAFSYFNFLNKVFLKFNVMSKICLKDKKYLGN